MGELELMESTHYKKREISNPLYNFIVKDEYIYCFSWKYNCFLKINILSGEIVEKRVVKGYLANAYMMFRLIDIKNSVVAFPYTADCILKWDLSTVELRKIPLLFKSFDDVSFRKFNTFAVKENEIFLFPASANYICRFNFETDEIKNVLDIRKYLYDKYQLQYSFLCANGSYLAGDKVYLGCWETNNMIEYDICTNSAELIYLGEITGGIRSICGSENRIFLLSSEGEIIVRKIDGTETKVISICDEEKKKYWNTGEERIVSCYGYVFAFPEKVEFSKRIKISNGQIETLFDKQDIMEMKQGEAATKLFFGTFSDKRIYVYSSKGYIYCYDAVSKEKVGTTYLKYDADKLAQWIKENLDAPNKVREDGYIYRISDLIESTKKEVRPVLLKSNVGKTIYQNIL